MLVYISLGLTLKRLVVFPYCFKDFNSCQAGHRPYRMELSLVEDLQAKLSSTQLQLGAVQRNYDTMSGAHLLTCISCACPANLMATSTMRTLQAFC